jgi:hypothetical protein
MLCHVQPAAQNIRQARRSGRWPAAIMLATKNVAWFGACTAIDMFLLLLCMVCTSCRCPSRYPHYFSLRGCRLHLPASVHMCACMFDCMAPATYNHSWLLVACYHVHHRNLVLRTHQGLASAHGSGFAASLAKQVNSENSHDFCFVLVRNLAPDLDFCCP